MDYKRCVFECKSNYQYFKKDKRETVVKICIIMKGMEIKYTKPGSGNYPRYQSLYQPFPQR